MNVRRPAPADLDEVLALCRAADEVVWGDSDWTRDDLAADWESLGDDTEAWVVELDGRIAGYTLYEERSGGRHLGDGYVHPELRGRGVGSRLLDLVEEHARGRAGEGAVLQTACLAGDEAAPRVFASRGFERTEHFFRMVVTHDEEPPAPSWPEGFELSTYEPADARDLYEAYEEAFAEEPGHRRGSFEEFEKRVTAAKDFDPSLVWLVREGGELAAFDICSWKRFGDWGWVGTLGVRPRWRRRGLGEALLLEAFREFWRRGERTVALGVNANNPTGATRLYERVGMHVLWRADLYEKALA